MASDIMGCSVTPTEPKTSSTHASCSPCRLAQNKPLTRTLRSAPSVRKRVLDIINGSPQVGLVPSRVVR